jgi:hypothetical protein
MIACVQVPLEGLDKLREDFSLVSLEQVRGAAAVPDGLLLSQGHHDPAD